MPECLIQEVMLLLLAWLITSSYRDWQLIKRERAKRQARRPKVRRGVGKEKKGFEGVTKKPECEVCRREGIEPQGLRVPPPLMVSKKGRRRRVDSGMHYCPEKSCRYYGWPGRGNISSNGHPNGGAHRQLHCRACGVYFMETKGTIFYRKRYSAEQITRAIAALAEGVGIRAVGRIFGVEPETILAWLAEAGEHLAAFNAWMTRELAVEQVQLDELYGVIRAWQAGELSEGETIDRLDGKRSGVWLWTAIDPVSKFWLAFEVGDRGVRQAWGLVHKVASALREGIVPLFITDGNRACEQPLLSHYGEWREPQAGQRKARWVPLPQLQYAQVVKKRRRRRIVSVSKRVVFGSLTRIKEILTPHGWQINTAFVERHNLTLRQHIAGLGRRVNTLAHSPQRLEEQAHLAMAYYNFCLPSRSLAQRTPAMALGLTNRVWRLNEVLLFRPPPFPQTS